MRKEAPGIQHVAGVHADHLGRVIRFQSHVASRPVPPLTMTATREIFCFGEFELDVDAGELRRKDRRLKIQPQPFKLLLLLVRKRGGLVTREEIRRELWPDGTFVDFD